MENENLGQFNQTGQEDTINLRHYWHVILERRWLIMTAFISVFVLSLIYLFKATPIYRATARLQIDPEADNILRVEGIVMARQEQDYLQTQYKNLLSRTLIRSVFNQLNLKDDERYARALDPVTALVGDLQVAPIRLSRLVDISAEHPDASQAARVVNAWATNFMRRNLDQKITNSLDVVERLKDEIGKQRIDLEAAERKVQEYTKSKKIVSFDEGENIVLQALKQYTDQLAVRTAAADAAQKVVEEVDIFLKQGVAIDALPQVADNAPIQELKKELALAEAIFDGIKKRYLHGMIEYQQAEANVQSLRSSLNKQAATLIEALRHRAQMSKAEKETVGLLVKQQSELQQNLKDLRVQYDILKRESAEKDSLYKAVLAKVNEMELTARNKINNINVVYDADVPLKHVKPRTLLTIFLGIIGGLGVALGLAFFVNYLDDSIKSQDDVETYLRLPFLGYVPNIKTNSVVERDLQAHSHPQSNAAEGFRTIRATISLTHKPDQFRTVAITSTIPSEGKSLVASNLAIVTAQTGLRTLLIDADLRRPSVHKAYRLHSPMGLSSFLMDEVKQIDPIIHKTEVPNLDVICCGSVPSNPSELIGSKRMSEFLEAVRGKYDRILLDCPPISAVSDPLIIAAMSDGVLFVTKFNKIRREHARKSIQRVQNAGIHIVGVVLNDIDFEGKDSYYYSYYYYQNRYYSSHYRSAGERAKDKSSGTGKSAERN
ncbi:MAG: polysaccharide biosynthesis tyrosine autokinase [Verrucomicrobia bacterium]|nr:polysaccharide biosynthesis tyrosine autokinase [Verrucomicrobiota bacterium]